MRHIIYIFLISALFFSITSCSDKQYQVLFEQKKAFSDTTSQTGLAAASLYRIKAQDVLQVRNLQDVKYIANETATSSNVTQGSASLGQTYQVDEEGNVTLPAINSVPVAGLTRFEAEKKLQQLYITYGLKDPIIEVKITNLKVTLLGETRTQGNFPLTRDKTTLIELIGQAGGLTEKADEKHVKIIRGTEKNPNVILVDLNDIQSINSPRSVLQNGDIVYITQNGRAIRTDNLQNFSTIYQPALILLNTALLILTLIRR